MAHGFVATAFGRLHYLRAGEGAPLVLIHSNGQSGHSFSEVAKILSPRFDIVAIDASGERLEIELLRNAF